MKTNQYCMVLVRILLICAGFGWFISAVGVVMPWSFVSGQLEGLGAQNLPSDPMLNYWLRMTAGAFTFIGILFFAAALNPIKSIQLIRLLAWFMICEGVLLLAWGHVLNLFIIPYAIDGVFCLLIGAGLSVLSRTAGTGTSG